MSFTIVNLPSTVSFVSIDTRTAPNKVIMLPAASTVMGRLFTIKDQYGGASLSTYILSTVGMDKIDGRTWLYTFSNAFGAISFLSDGRVGWRVVGLYDGSSTALPRAAVSFVPTSISGIQLWMDGADPAGTGVVPSNGTVLTSWIDKSGNSKNAVGINSPTVVTNAVNSKSAVSYNGSSYSYSSITAGTFSTAMNIFFVYKVNGSVSYMAPMTRGQGNNGSPIDQYNGTRYLGGGSYNGYTSAWSHASATSTTLFSQIIQQSPSTTYNEYVNGSTTSSLSVSGFSSSDSGTVVYIATRDDKVTSFNGYMCELIVYNQMVGLTAQQKIEGYLAWKWGSQASLPVGHPYYSAPP